MTKINDGGPAYPFEGGFNHGPLVSLGMTLRDHFAGLAMQAAFSKEVSDGLTYLERAKWAYRQADAMIQAREK